jgi:subtilisin family serine protease
MAQSQLNHTHTAVFFYPEVSKEARLAVLQKHGLADLDQLSLFHHKSVAIINKDNVDLDGLIAANQVEYLSPVHSNAKNQFVTYRSNFFVHLNHESDLDLLANEVEKLGVHMVGPNRFVPTIIEVKTEKYGMNSVDAVRALKATRLFKTVSPNLMHSVSDCAVNDPRFNRQWNLKNEGSSIQGSGTAGADIDAELAWTINIGSPDVKIVIVDSGIDTLHPELEGKLLPGFDAMGDGTNGYPTPNYDGDGHGTSCAGIAAANTNNTLGIAGVCQGCQVYPVRVFNYEVILGEVQPWSETAFFLDAMGWQTQADIDVSSNSWAVPDVLLALYPGSDTLVNAVIDEVVENGRGGLGVPMLFSSGNDGITDTIPLWPARYEKTIAVGATSMCDEHKTPTSCDGENWWAGNWGEGLDVSAPGVRIATIDMLGTNGFHNTEYYDNFNGTSAACPNAAGTMALILSEFPQMPEWMARKVLNRGSEKVGGYDYSTWKADGGWSKELGYGRINAYNSLVYGATSINSTSGSQSLIETHADRHVVVLPNQKVEWGLFDINGRLVQTGFAANAIQVQHEGLGTGIYALRIQGSNFTETVKLVIP